MFRIGGYFNRNIWNDEYRHLKASIELFPIETTSPSETRLKLTGFFSVPTQEIKGYSIRYFFFSSAMDKISSLAYKSNIYINKYQSKQRVKDEKCKHTFMKQITRSTIDSCVTIRIFFMEGISRSIRIRSLRHSTNFLNIVSINMNMFYMFLAN